MPLYEYACPAGCRFEKLGQLADTGVPCPHGQATRALSAFARPPAHAKHASEFKVTPSMRAALDEATGYKNEALQHKQEAEANGFAVSQER